MTLISFGDGTGAAPTVLSGSWAVCLQEGTDLANGEGNPLLRFLPWEHADLGLWRRHRGFHGDSIGVRRDIVGQTAGSGRPPGRRRLEFRDQGLEVAHGVGREHAFPKFLGGIRPAAASRRSSGGGSGHQRTRATGASAAGPGPGRENGRPPSHIWRADQPSSPVRLARGWGIR